jgi:hypothetical protein
VEPLAKIVVYVVVGVIVLAINVWFFRALYQSVSGGDLVVAPVKVIGSSGDTTALGETLARMLIVKIQEIEWGLEQSQSSLRQAEAAKTGTPNTSSEISETSGGVTGGIFGTPKTAGLNAHLFEPTSIDIKVGGVDVGGLLPRIQRWFVEDRH